MENEVLITTVDNPIDPFEDFKGWWNEDHRRGYNSWEKVARFCSQSQSMTKEEELEDIERAIDEVIRYDFTGLYRKVDRQRAKELVQKRNSETFSIESLYQQ